MSVVEFVCDKVTQAGYEHGKPEWWGLVGGVLQAWRYASEMKVLDDRSLRMIAKTVDYNYNFAGYKVEDITGHLEAGKPSVLMNELLGRQDLITAREFYNRFMEIKPFHRNNMLVGVLVYNFLNKTLYDPKDV